MSVIIVGAGLAGLVAAITAASNGARVLLLEKESSLGGNSAKATSGMNACGTEAQRERAVVDSTQAFFRDTIASGQGLTDTSLARILSTQSLGALKLLAQFGVNLDAVTQCGGHSLPRTHYERPLPDGKPRPVGWDIVAALRKAVEANPGVTVLKSCRVTALVQDMSGFSPDTALGSRPVTGVKVQCATEEAAAAVAAKGGIHDADPHNPLSLTLSAEAVVLTTGGFGADHTSTSLLMQYAPQIASLPTTNGAFSTGDGAKVARMAGAHLRGMEHVQVHPTGFVLPEAPDAKTVFLAPEALRGFGGILLNGRGQRFVDELGRRDQVTREMFRWCYAPQALEAAVGAVPAPGAVVGDALPLPRPAVPRPVHAYLVMTAGAVAKYGPNAEFYIKKGLLRQVAGAAGVAAAIGGEVSPADVAASLRTYAAAAAAGKDGEHGKTVFPDLFEGAEGADTLYLAIVTPAIHYTMGGVAASSAAELQYADMSEVVRGNMTVPEQTRYAPEPNASDWVAFGADEGVATTAAAVVPPHGPPEPAREAIPAPASSPGPATSSAAAPPPAGQAAFQLPSSAPEQMRQAADADVPMDFVEHDVYTSLYEKPVLRSIPRLFGAGEVTGGLHGMNRLAGNSLLECVVFGQIAGERAASTLKKDTPALRPDGFTPLTFRESHRVTDSIYIYRFNLPSVLHGTGLKLGEYVAVRAVVGGEEITRFYSPVSRPEIPGLIDLLIKVDPHGTGMPNHLNHLAPGDALEFRGPLGGPNLEGLRPGADPGRVKRVGLICGGTGIAPALQLLRMSWVSNIDVPIKLIYSAPVPAELAFLPWLRRKSRIHKNFTVNCAVDSVPPGATWNEHVGFVNEALVKSSMWAPGEDVLIIVCGPYPMCQAVKRIMTKLGFTVGSGASASAGDMCYSYM